MKKNTIILTILLLVCSCHYRITNYPSLVNQGILPVSKDQAYVGSNLFLSREMEKSVFLYNFLRKQGAPDAIEIVRRPLSSDRFYMYYFDAKEVYVADPKVRGDRREWIIKGPRIPNWRDIKELKNVIDFSGRDAPFVIDGKQEFFSKGKPSQNAGPIRAFDKDKTRSPIDLSTLPKEPPLKKPIKRKYVPKKRNVVAKKIAPTPKLEANKEEAKVQEQEENFLASLEDLKTYKPINSDKMAIAMSKGYARRDDNGNVVHTVKSYTETLQAISFWYTGSEINAVEIEKFNNLSDASNLKIGQNILIPFNLLKNVKEMPKN